ncbi:MAG TPA: hypothetical protein VK280_00785 [Streptosporangiaceae bacterium]|nr:hypothetical protein [Streptosporangiaceae bacterium]
MDFLPMIGGALARIPTVLFAFIARGLTAGIVTAVVFAVYTQIEFDAPISGSFNEPPSPPRAAPCPPGRPGHADSGRQVGGTGLAVRAVSAELSPGTAVTGPASAMRLYVPARPWATPASERTRHAGHAHTGERNPMTSPYDARLVEVKVGEQTVTAAEVTPGGGVSGPPRR